MRNSKAPVHWDPRSDVSLSGLAMATTMYNSLTYFNESLASLRTSTRNSLKLANAAHQKRLMDFLNDWGCRHLSENCHEDACSSILTWHQSHGAGLFPSGKPLSKLSDADLEAAAVAYDSLKDMAAASKTRNGSQVAVRIGPTAASKVLFVLRPEALMPWDKAMRKAYNCSGDGQSYFSFLKQIQQLMQQIDDQCAKNGFPIDSLPKRLGRPKSTVLELINEYLYVTVTRTCKLPSARQLARWAKWD